MFPLKEVDASLKDRIFNALTVLVTYFFSGVFAIVWAPIAALDTFFKKKHYVLDVDAVSKQIKPKSINPDNDEPWKRQHDAEYN